MNFKNRSISLWVYSLQTKIQIFSLYNITIDIISIIFIYLFFSTDILCLPYENYVFRLRKLDSIIFCWLWWDCRIYPRWEVSWIIRLKGFPIPLTHPPSPHLFYIHRSLNEIGMNGRFSRCELHFKCSPSSVFLLLKCLPVTLKYTSIQ